MGITYGDYLIDSGYYDITPKQEREIEAREECARRGIDPDDICADGGVTAWMVVDQERHTRKRPIYSWVGDDCPPQWRRVGTIDVADPADVATALDRGRRIGSIYDGKSYSVAEPCAADIYEERAADAGLTCAECGQDRGELLHFSPYSQRYIHQSCATDEDDPSLASSVPSTHSQTPGEVG